MGDMRPSRHDRLFLDIFSFLQVDEQEHPDDEQEDEEGDPYDCLIRGRLKERLVRKRLRIQVRIFRHHEPVYPVGRIKREPIEPASNPHEKRTDPRHEIAEQQLFNRPEHDGNRQPD